MRRKIDPRSPANSWRTPPDLFRLHMPYGADVDAFATEENSLGRAFLRDAFAEQWRGHVWANPPFDLCGEAVARAWHEWAVPYSAVESITMLLPANRTDRRWWQDLIEFRRDLVSGDLTTRFIGRVKFIRPDGRPGPAPPFGCVLLYWTRPEDSATI